MFATNRLELKLVKDGLFKIEKHKLIRQSHTELKNTTFDISEYIFYNIVTRSNWDMIL